MYVLSIQKRKGRIMNWRILEGSEDGFMTAILHTNTLRELKYCRRESFRETRSLREVQDTVKAGGYGG